MGRSIEQPLLPVDICTGFTKVRCRKYSLFIYSAIILLLIVCVLVFTFGGSPRSPARAPCAPKNRIRTNVRPKIPVHLKQMFAVKELKLVALDPSLLNCATTAKCTSVRASPCVHIGTWLNSTTHFVDIFRQHIDGSDWKVETMSKYTAVITKHHWKGFEKQVIVSVIQDDPTKSYLKILLEQENEIVEKAFDRFEPMDHHGIIMPSDPSRFLIWWSNNRFIHCNATLAEKFAANSTIITAEHIGNLKVFTDLLLASGQIPSLAYGTLLGWYRNCGVIPYTTDIDVAVKVAEYQDDFMESLKTRTDFRLLRYIGMEEYGLEMTVKIPGTVNNTYVDVFYMFPENSTFDWTPITYDKSSGWARLKTLIPKIKELCTGDVLGFLFFVPCNFLDVIVTSYGQTDWLEPQENFMYTGHDRLTFEDGNWNKNLDDVIQTSCARIHRFAVRYREESSTVMDSLHRAIVEDLLLRVKKTRYRLLITYPKAPECRTMLQSLISRVANSHDGCNEAALYKTWEDIAPRNRGRLKEDFTKQKPLIGQMIRCYARCCQKMPAKKRKEGPKNQIEVVVISDSEQSIEDGDLGNGRVQRHIGKLSESDSEPCSVANGEHPVSSSNNQSDLDSDCSVQIISPPCHPCNSGSISPDEADNSEEGVQFGELIVDGEFADYYATSATQFRMEFSLLTDATRSHRLLSRYFVDSCAPRDPPKEVSLVVAAYVDKLFDSTSAECPSIEGDVEDIVYVGGYNMAAFRQEMPTSGRHLRAESLEELMDVVLQYRPRKKSLDVFVEVPEDLRRREVNAERHAEIFAWIVAFFAAAHPEVHVVVLAPLHEDTRRLSFDTTVNYFEKLKQLRTLKNVRVLYSQNYVKKMSAFMDDEGRLKNVTAIGKAFRLIEKEMKS
ncbi:hypothetical protein QR680_007745 [Steinernema hermaphroditum]|uniref:Uncharacterized protein n=1 Tax=Steinernema hermaphroditum TaxID=289476 RepID=A0AA39IGL0_9BILA|nr:hypothetical protein QR680_007745 [Steinernema hermaphroditum]